MFFAQSPDDLATKEDVISVSGLEFMQMMLAGKGSGPPIANTLNYRLHSGEDGRVSVRGTPPFAGFNPFGVPHGGWYGAFLDTCLGCAVMTGEPKGSVYTTLEYKVNILRPVPADVEVEGIGILQHAGRSTGIATAEMRGLEDARLYATGSTTCIIMKRG